MELFNLQLYVSLVYQIKKDINRSIDVLYLLW
jgi:hypothetical protein